MKKRIRLGLLRALKAAGLFDRVREGKWRRNRLLILCYHGMAIDQENQWRPALFTTASRLRERFEMLKQGGYNVLSLNEGLKRLQKRDLPARSVVLTFDDGTVDFYTLAYPLLREFKFPATVYQTTYYCSRPVPVFPLICSYLLWKARESRLGAAPSIGVPNETALHSLDVREAVVRRIAAFTEQQNFSTEQKSELAAELAERLGLKYQEILRKRVLQLMNPAEIAEVAAGGVAVELHTHRHRTPHDRVLFEKEIRDNRNEIEAITKTRPRHFCYPSGDYEQVFLPWLAELGVESATTCDPGITTVNSPPLILPRFVDTTGQTALEFEAWLTGVGALLQGGRVKPKRQPRQAPDPHLVS
jgi:peptidoglycan/xylan/chitin deacetylase (PgdA/CDA1 family)